jgi:uncharacterized protein YlxP (DUF503 family)
MVVGTLEISIKIEGAFSLKDKRRVLRSLLDRARRDYRVAASEVEDQELWNSSVVGIACVSNDAAHAESILQQVVDLFDSNPEVNVEDAIKRIARD